MTNPSLPTYADLQRATAPLALSPAELHGGLCGFICAGGQPAAGQWLPQLHIDPDGLGPADADALEILRRHTLDELGDDQLGFQPLLPDDETAVTGRVTALSEWCAGFLGGFGLTGVEGADFWSDDARDAIADLERIARFGYEAGDAEEDETALMEILEFVRVAALLLRQESQPLRAPAGATRH